jgi:Protein of unknown function DUF262/Protein of unknown function (DUF1524)
MEQSGIGLTFREVGIANVLAQHQLSVPVNQRSYAWEDHVEALFHDLTKAIDGGARLYFLGTIVLTQGAKGIREVADGQQRLATISILIAAIRDYLIELGDEKGASAYSEEYLCKYNVRSQSSEPKLRLNFEDHEYYFNTFILSPSERSRTIQEPELISHRKLRDAANLAREHVRNVTAAYRQSERLSRLYDWVEFLKEAAVIIEITVPGYLNAFRMFETLNARGLKASQTDILKNFLFDKAREHLSEVHPRWFSMVSKIESMGDDDLLLTYVRHFWIAHHGPTTERDLGPEIENVIQGERQAISMINSLDTFATDYIALLTPADHPRWADFDSKTRNYIATITQELGIEQIRPLMLAVAQFFEIEEAKRAFRMFLSWSVRFLIVGGGGGGNLDRHYGLRAKEISTREIRSAKLLAERMADVIPGNEAFRNSFRTTNVRRTNLARYYLRALEDYLAHDPEPQLIQNRDTAAVNLEHVLPVIPGSEWKISSDIAAVYYKRLGNMVLMRARDNVRIANKPFPEKREAYRISPFQLTNEVAQYEEWGPNQIEERQTRLASLAPKVWPI